ncbi:UDP-N-acetylmuramyl peptide synthase [Bacillus sp. FJAT-18017]|uniref:cyanophycin synthetase n=1 Tax=Bacillus sp. FJAT-18017 TaxID=1705566 RepID=UPI0006AE7C47|nr:cyanophycin synthetase [Bacillus sp. FJAT-18017]ALC91210.1 UDP-N-acetylmuramyl peptide synthase [Bacillus sp. FJAT-18017]
MEIKRVRYLKGPNYFNYKPTMWIELDLEELEFSPSNSLPRFNDALLKSVPSLQDHTCSLGYEGGFVERLNEGTWMGHILEHLAIELQCLAGIKVRRGKTLTSSKKGVYYVTYDYREPKSGFYAFEAAKEIVERILNGEADVDAKPYIDKIEQLYYENKLGPSTEAIYNAAFEKGIPVERVGSDSLVRIGTGSKQKFVQATITSQTPHIAVENSCDKQVTKELLAGAGLPVPKGETASSIEDIFETGERVGFPLVIKPLNGRQGRGVFTNIRSREELFSILNCLETPESDYIVERYFEGSDFRLLVVDDKLIAASMRIAPFVIGNGKDSISALIEEENKNPLRGDGHEKPMSKIPLNSIVSCYLEKSNLTLDSVPEPGKVIQVVGNANLSTGGLAIDVTDEVHPSIRRMAVSAAKAIGLDVAGIDLICPDITNELDRNTTTIVEVNAAPGIRMHHYPSKGTPRNVGKAIVDYLFKTSKEASIPIISVTGTNGKTTTTRLVKHFLERDGYTVGMTNSDGVYIGSQTIDEGDCSGPISARKILHSHEVDAAVLETARGGILREGLAFRQCDVGIVTNVTEDHLGLDGIEDFGQLVKLKRLIPEVVMEGGYCILNADDPEVVQMAAYTRGNIIYTSVFHTNHHIHQAIENGWTVWYLNEDNWIICVEDGQEIKLLPASDIPVTIQGKAKHNISNLLQAFAAAYSQGVSFEVLKEKALTFIPDPQHSKGRFNTFQLAGRNIIVDYAHNIAGLHAFFDTARHFRTGTTTTVISSPGDRQDHEIREMARIAVRNADRIIIREDADLRGRAPLETANMMHASALKEKGISKKQLLIIPDEFQSYYEAWNRSKEGDTLIFLFEKYSVVSEFISQISNTTNTLVKKII